MKKVIALMLSLLLIFAFVACSTEPESEEVTGTTEIKITDVTGREITLPQIATKVVGTHNPSLNAVVVLGGGEKYIAGFGNKEMSRGLYSEVIKNYDDLVQIGKAGNINYESVIATGADLAVLPERFKDQADKFSEVGVNALIALPNRESFDTVKASLAMIGQALGEDERASAINAFLDSKITKAQEISSKAADKPSVLFLGGSSPLSVAPAAMIQTQLIETAGGTNAVSDVDGEGDFIEVNIEQIIAWNPDVIWFPSYTDYTAEDLLNNPAWSSIDAVKNKKVYRFPSTLEPWDQPTAALALGISWATYSLHPDLYTFEDMMGDADEFYNLVYGRTFTAEQLGVD